MAPLRRDPRVTRWGFYMWHFKFLPERWEGVTRDDFLRALRAEGLSGGTGHTQPLYKNPLFLDPEQALGRTGFPPGGLYQGRMDYREVVCPETERIYATEAVHLGHPLFLGPPEDMDAILGAIEKVWRHRDALRESPEPAGRPDGTADLSRAVRAPTADCWPVVAQSSPPAAALSRRRAGAGPGRPSCRRGSGAPPRPG